MIPSTAKVPDFATVPIMDNIPSSDSQVEAPTAATNVVCDARRGIPKSSGEPKSDFCEGGC